MCVDMMIKNVYCFKCDLSLNCFNGIVISIKMKKEEKDKKNREKKKIKNKFRPFKVWR